MDKAVVTELIQEDCNEAEVTERLKEIMGGNKRGRNFLGIRQTSKNYGKGRCVRKNGIIDLQIFG